MAKIGIDLDRKIGSVDRRIFGNFIEHLGRCIYGGIYEEGSPLSDARGFRQDVLEAARPLRIPILRWPGGNFVSGYHWLDGVGPKDSRPRKTDLAWYAEESNRFGTDEFIEYCRALGTEPYICVNMGSGSMDEAQAWVEYTNGTGNTHWANLRRKHGHAEPYRIKYWGLGNEMYGAWQVGNLGAEDYVKKARAFAMVMKRTDPSIVLVSCGQNGWSPWDETVLEGLASMVDFHSIHIYTGHPDYYVNVFQPHQAERAIRICERSIERVRYNQRIAHPISIAYDEWNVWYRARGSSEHETGRTRLEEIYNFEDALAMGMFLNSFIRHADIVKMANLAQIVNVIAPIFTSKEGLFLQPIYFPLAEYARQRGTIALDVWVKSPEYRPSGRAPLGYLDVSATRDKRSGAVYLNVLNRSRDRGITAAIENQTGEASPAASVWELNHPDLKAVHTFGDDKKVRPATRSVTLKQSGGAFEYTFPAHSLTILKLSVR
jgi:alpha-N-arabinofuranosidase